MIYVLKWLTIYFYYSVPVHPIYTDVFIVKSNTT